MKIVQAPANERERLNALAQYQLLDTYPEAAYDAFALLAREISGSRMSAVSLIDERRQWFKAVLGFNLREIPRDGSFCAHVIASGMPLIVDDTASDPRFCDSSLVTADPHVRFYASIPLTTPNGFTIGTLCVLDDRPRTLSAEQLRGLQVLAKALMGVLEARRRALALLDAARVGAFSINPSDGRILFVSYGASERLGYSVKELIGTSILDHMPTIAQSAFRESAKRTLAGEMVVGEAELRQSDGTLCPVELRLDVTNEGDTQRILVIAVDLTLRKQQQREIGLLLGAINVAGDVILVYQVNEHGTLDLAYMNDAYASKSGYGRDEAIGRSIEHFRQAMPDDEGMRSVRSAIATGRPTQA